MICPARGNNLTKLDVAGVRLDVCQGGCGGVWFDNYELSKMDEPHEAAGDLLMGVERDESITVDHSQKRLCPRCEGVTLMRHFHSLRHEVEVDECASCGGIWLDQGELATIRNQYSTFEERTAVEQACFERIFSEELTALENEEGPKPDKVWNILKFICPSYYLSKALGAR